MKNGILAILTIIILIFGGLIYLGHPSSTLSLILAGLDLFEEKQSVSYEDKSGTLAGIDKDGNGVRDDVERFIRENTKEFENEHRDIFISYAKSLQSISTVDRDIDTEITNTVRIKSRRLHCVVFSDKFYNSVNYREKRALLKDIQQLALNTREREQNYFSLMKKVKSEDIDQLLFISRFSQICGVQFKNESYLISRMYVGQNIELKGLMADLRRASKRYPELMTKSKRNEIIKYFKSFIEN
jgi:hypothetical protein